MGRSARMQLCQLDKLPMPDLKDEWERTYGSAAPRLSADLLRLGIAYKLQEKRSGGISRETKRILRQKSQKTSESGSSAAPPPRKLSPGTRLVRDWRGVGHTVTVQEKGFEYDGQIFRSLTAIAKAITGTHRNGPRFFGLTQ